MWESQTEHLAGSAVRDELHQKCNETECGRVSVQKPHTETFRASQYVNDLPGIAPERHSISTQSE